jgi:hypothetical protein
MLFTQSISRTLAIIAICTFITTQLPTFAESTAYANKNSFSTGKAAQAVLDSARHPKVSQVENSTLLASCGGCNTSDLCAVGAMGTTMKRKKDSSVLSDSLWGNLILEMAVQRDREIKSLTKKMNIVNVGTMAAILGIAGGSLAQSVTSLATTNGGGHGATGTGTPVPKLENHGHGWHFHELEEAGHDHGSTADHQDSIAPSVLGIALSGATLATFTARIYFGHKYGKKLKQRQLVIRNQIEQILHDLEHPDNHTDVESQLASLIGPRATGEFLQLWQSSHQLASTNRNTISLNAEPNKNLEAMRTQEITH